MHDHSSGQWKQTAIVRHIKCHSMNSQVFGKNVWITKQKIDQKFLNEKELSRKKQSLKSVSKFYFDLAGKSSERLFFSKKYFDYQAKNLTRNSSMKKTYLQKNSLSKVSPNFILTLLAKVPKDCFFRKNILTRNSSMKKEFLVKFLA